MTAFEAISYGTRAVAIVAWFMIFVRTLQTTNGSTLMLLRCVAGLEVFAHLWFYVPAVGFLVGLWGPEWPRAALRYQIFVWIPDAVVLVLFNGTIRGRL